VRAVWRRVASTSIALWTSTGIAFIGTIVAARALGPSEYGTAILALATTGLISSFLDITLEQGLVHHGFRAIAADDPPGLLALIRNGALMDGAAGLIVTAVIVAFAGPIADVATGGAVDASLIQLAALTGLVTTLDPSTSAVLQIGERPDLTAWAQALASVARVAAILAAIIAGFGAVGVVVATGVGSAAGSFLQTALAWRLVRRRWPVRPRRGEMRKTARTLVPFAIHSSLTQSLLAAGNSIIPIVLGRFAGTSAVAEFKIAQLPITASALAGAPLKLVMYAEMTKRATSGRIADLRHLVVRWTRIGWAIAVPGAIAGFFLLPWLIPELYGEAFDDSVPAAQIMLAPAFVGFAFGWMKNFLAATGRPAVGTALTLFPLLLSGPLTAAFADNGAVAGAVGLSFSAVAMCLGQLVITWRWFRRQEAEQAAGRARPSEEPAGKGAVTAPRMGTVGG
jgi:O-antigen/teichoic acid export membrane protein